MIDVGQPFEGEGAPDPAKAPEAATPPPADEAPAAGPEQPSAAPASAEVPATLPAEARLVGALIRFALIGVSIALAVWWMRDEQRVAHIISNQTTADERKLAIKLMLIGIGVFTTIPILYIFGYRIIRKAWLPAIDWVVFASRLSAPLLMAFLLPPLFDWKVFQGHDLLLGITATFFGLGLERSLRSTFTALFSSRAGPWPARLVARFPRVTKHVSVWTVVTLTVAFAYFFSFFTIRQHHRLGTRSWDMAIFDNIMWNLIRGHWFKASPDIGPVGSHIQYHANFLAYLFAPFYAIYQKPETLLFLQATLCGAAAIPLYLVATRRLESRLGGLCIAVAYLLYAPLHGPIFYDFHFFTTAPFFVTWVIYCFETNRRAWLVVTWIAALLLREEIGAGLSMAALLYLFSGRRVRWALIGGLVSAIYFFLVKFWIMPLHRQAGPDTQTFTWMFSGLLPPGESSYSGVLQTVVINPLYTLMTLLEFDKLTYVFMLFGPVLLLPFRHRLTWILFLPGLLFTLLATGYKPVIMPTFQYTSNYNQYMFFAAAVAIGALATRPDGRVLKASAVTALLVTSIVFSFHNGAVLQKNTFRGGFGQVSFSWSKGDAKRLAQLRELIAMIPPDASVAATEMEAPHVSGRENCYTIRFFTFNADYLLANLDEVSWGSSRTNMLAAIETKKYGFIASRGRFGLWGRKYSHKKDEEGNKLLGIAP
jgi:uncharacterized membrane protein